MKRYPISAKTLQTYVTAGFAMIGLGVFIALMGLIMLLSMIQFGGSANTRRAARMEGQALLMSLGTLVAGLALAFGSRVPFQRSVQMRNSYIDIGEGYLEWADPERGVRRLEFSEVVDLYETETTLKLEARGGKSMELTNEYENFEEMVGNLKLLLGRG